MIKPWLFEFLHQFDRPEEEIKPEEIREYFQANLEQWKLMESLDYEGVFFSEHHFQSSYSPSPNLLIATLAQHTSRMRLGTMGVVLPFYAPWRVVEEIAMLDHLTGGRLEIGCASGVPQELNRVGIEAEEARGRFSEALDILDAALAEPVISYHGEYWNFDDLSILPRPLQQPAPPKWTTVVSKGSARRSAGRGSKICTGFQSVEAVAELFDVYRDEAGRLGIPVGPDDIGIRRNISVSTDEGEAREDSEGQIDMLAGLLSKDKRYALDLRAILDAPPAESGFSVHRDEFISGTPDQVAEQIVEQCRTAGAGHFLAMMGRGAPADRHEQVVLYGEKVIPQLRKASVG